MNRAQRILIRGEDHDWLDRHGIVDMTNRIPIWFADDGWCLGNDAAGQEGGDVQLLPGCEVIADNDCDLGVEHAVELHSGYRGKRRPSSEQGGRS